MKKELPILDLHGAFYPEVEDKLVDFFFWEENKEGIIVTGQSHEMQKMVIDWLEEYDYNYHIPYNNEGRIIVR